MAITFWEVTATGEVAVMTVLADVWLVTATGDTTATALILLLAFTLLVVLILMLLLVLTLALTLVWMIFPYFFSNLLRLSVLVRSYSSVTPFFKCSTAFFPVTKLSDRLARLLVLVWGAAIAFT